MSTINLGSLTSSGYTKTDSVTPGFGADPNDYYSFTLGDQANVTFQLTGISGGDTDLYLYQFDGTPVGASTWGGNSDEFINSILNPGDYLLSVSPFYGNVNYTLSIGADFPTAPITDYSDWGMNYAYNLGTLMAGTDITSAALPEHSLALQGPDLLGNTGGDWDDAYSFTIDAPSTVTISLTPDANSAVTLELYDSENQWLSGNYSGYTGSVTADLVPGTYWVNTGFAWTDNSNGNASYDLNFTAVDNTPPPAVVVPVPITDAATTLVNGMLSLDGSIAISGVPVYSGNINQAALVSDFAGQQNDGILLSTGNAVKILGQTYNQFAGSDTSSTETVKNWANSGGPGATGRSYMQKGNAGSAGTDSSLDDTSNSGAPEVFQAISALADAQGLDPVKRVYDATGLSFDFTTENNSINFDIMFGSEEFPFFANKYVDGATIIVDGKNYALFDLMDPTTLLSVTQSNVDAGYFNANTQYMNDTSAVTGSTYATEFNGISDAISILAPLDTTLATHSISISIADTNDHVLDSGLFMSNLHGVDINGDSAGRDDLFGLLVNIGDETVGADVTVGGDADNYSESGAGDDSTNGGDGRDVLFGDAGDDSVEGGAGSDYVDGGTGNDVVTGDVVDTTSGGTGTDPVVGGDDTLSGGEGSDTVDGGAGDDSVDGGTGDDTVDGGTGDDNVSGGDGRDDLFGGEGDDVIVSGDSTDTTGDSVDGGTGDDTVTGAAGDDTMTGGTGTDSVDGGAGNDVITGGTDTLGDNLDGGTGNDTVTGGTGNDTVSGGDGRDNLFSGGGDDVIVGGDSSDTTGDNIGSGAGNDGIMGAAGNDSINAGTGNDSIDGGAGDDSVIAGTGNDTITTDTGADTVNAGAGNDVIIGGTDTISDVVIGGEGKDTVVGGDSSDSVTGGAGNDSVSSGAGADTVDAGAGNDVVTGGTDMVGDSLAGGAGNDAVTGGGSDDTVSGGIGNDIISGGDGSDTVSGGAGRDTFVLDSTDGVDTIADFSVPNDTVELTLPGLTEVTQDNFVINNTPDSFQPSVIYDSNAGSLSFDGDGNGPDAPVELAIIGANLGLTSADFMVI